MGAFPALQADLREQGAAVLCVLRHFNQTSSKPLHFELKRKKWIFPSFLPESLQYIQALLAFIRGFAPNVNAGLTFQQPIWRFATSPVCRSKITLTNRAIAPWDLQWVRYQPASAWLYQ